MVALKWSMQYLYGVNPGEVYWAASDIGWVVGHSYIVYAPLVHGNTTVLFEGKPVGMPDAGTFWRVISEHKVRALFTAPTAFRAIKRADPLALVKVWQGGMSFHGGLIGVLVAIALFARRRGRSILDVFDFTAPLPAIGLGAGRIGNFINGELWGKSTDVPWGFLVDGEVRHASQLYESLLEGLVLFLVLWWFTSRPRPQLAPSGLFLLLYGTFRFLIEFVRLPDADIGYLAFGWLTMGQLLSLPMIVAGFAMLAWASSTRRPSGNYA